MYTKFPTYKWNVLVRYLLTYLLTSWLCGPLRALTSIIRDAKLPPSFYLIYRKTFSPSSNLLSLGLTVFLVPSHLFSIVCLTTLPWSIPNFYKYLRQYPIFVEFLQFQLFLILQIALSTTDQYIRFNKFLFHAFKLFLSFSLMGRVHLHIQLVLPLFIFEF